MKKSNPGRNKILGLIGLGLVLAVFSYSLLEGYYYLSNFSNNTDGWELLYKYGRDGYIDNGNATARIRRIDGVLRFDRLVNTSDQTMDKWTGRTARYDGATYSASRYAPFGVEFLRGTTRIDPHNDGSNGESQRHSAAQGFWLVSGTPPDGNIPNQTFDNLVFLYEMMKMDYNVSGNPSQPRSTWGYFVTGAQRFDLTQALRPAGGFANLIFDQTYTLEWNYDDNWGAGSSQHSGQNNSNHTRNYPVGIRLTHDGTRVRFYLNPNPTRLVGNFYPDEYLSVGSVAVNWSNDIRFMTGMETRRSDGEAHDSDIQSVLVRSVAKSLTAEIGPDQVAKGSQNDFNLVISPEFDSTDAGIGELTIAKPAAYTAPWDRGTIKVYSYNGTEDPHPVYSNLRKLTPVPSASFSGNNQVFIGYEDGTNLRIRFRQTDDVNNGVIREDTGLSDDDRKIVVVMPFTVPNQANGLGEEFIVYGNCVKYDGQSYGRWGTTGRIQARAGDASAAYPGDTLKVKTYSNPDARASLEPSWGYVGSSTVYLYVATTNVNSPDISELRIAVPAGYTLASNNPEGANYSSLLIDDDANNLRLIKENGTNFLVVDYKADGIFLPASGGMDRITIEAETPYGFTGASINTLWQAEVKSEVPGTLRTVCRQDQAYPNMALLVRQLPPVMMASLTTKDGNLAYNNISENLLTLTVRNNGGIGNQIKRIKISLPAVVTGVVGKGSAFLETDDGTGMIYDDSENALFIDYDSLGLALGPGRSDTIKFHIIDEITPMSDPVSYAFPVFADNFNDDGFVPASEGSEGWTIFWKRPPPVSSAHVAAKNNLGSDRTNFIHTSNREATEFAITLNNMGGPHNSLRLAEILVPGEFTNFINCKSVFHPDTQVEISGNQILVKYQGSGITDGLSDIISFKAADSVHLYDDKTVEFQIRAGNTSWTSNLVESGLVSGHTKKVDFIRPPLLASSSTIPSELDMNLTNHRLTVTITNSGESENLIGEVRVRVPDTVVSGIEAVSSTVLGESWGASPNIFIDNSGTDRILRVVYPPGKPFKGGMTEKIEFEIKQYAVDPGSFLVTTSASNAQNKWRDLDASPGMTNLILVRLPPAEGKISLCPNIIYLHEEGAEVKTNLLVLTITNTGLPGNSITNAVINYPVILQDKITSFSNRSGVPIDNRSSSKQIILDYQTDKLAGSKSDEIYIWYKTDHTLQAIDLPFSAQLDNGEEASMAGVLSGCSASLSLVAQPEIFVTLADSPSNQIYTTSSFSSLVFTLKNGISGGKHLIRLKLEVPDPFVSEGAVLDSDWPSSTEVITETNGRMLYINYATFPLDAGAVDPIKVGLSDILELGVTNVEFRAWAEYEDGSGFKPVRVGDGKSMGVEFVFPEASALARITPRRINMVTTSNQFVISLSNTGVSGNHIKKLEIDLGAQVTSIESDESLILGEEKGLVEDGHRIVFDYEAQSSYFPSGGLEVIRLSALYLVESVTNQRVKIRVSNTDSDDDYREVEEFSTANLIISYYRPDYLGSGYVEALNAVSSEKPNTVWTSGVTNTLRYTVVNDGAAGNDIEACQIFIPDDYFDPETLTNATSEWGGIIERSGNILTIMYTNKILNATRRDRIEFKINDLVTSTNASAQWVSTTLFNTSGGNYFTNQLVAGRSDTIYFEMPKPQAKARLDQRMIYSTTKRFLTCLSITNSASGSNAIEQVKITLPTGFRTGFDPTKLANSFASEVEYEAGVITLSYADFTPGRLDRIWLELSNSFPDTFSGQLPIKIANRVHEVSASEWVDESLLQRVVTAPSSYLEVSSPVENDENKLWSTGHEAEYRVFVRNDGTGDALIRRLRIAFPPGFEISAVASANVVSNGLSFASNYVWLDYPETDPLEASQWDAITLTASDPWQAGTHRAEVEVLVGGINQLDPEEYNTNYAPTRLYTGKSLAVDYAHPPVSSEFWIEALEFGAKPSILVAPKGGVATTNLKIILRNTGVDANKIYSALIKVPKELGEISNLTSLIPGAVFNKNDSQIEIRYQEDKLEAGEDDEIEFSLTYSQSDAINNLLFTVSAANTPDGPDQVSILPDREFANLDIVYPPIAVFSGILNDSALYTINTNARFDYQIRNRAQGYELTQVEIQDPGLGIFDQVEVVSARGGSLTVDKDSGLIRVEYPSGGIEFNEFDTLGFKFAYNLGHETVESHHLKATIFLTNRNLGIEEQVEATPLEAIDTESGDADNQTYTLGPAPYGRVSGRILPLFKTDKRTVNDDFLPNVVKVEILASSNNSVITSPYRREVGSDGKLEDKALIAYSDPGLDGRFDLDFIPDGEFRLRLTADGFRVTLTNIRAVSNQIRRLGRVMLKNDYFDSNLTNQQVVVDYNDTNTRFVLASGTLLDQFSLDISVVEMNQAQKSDVQRNPLVLTPAGTELLGCFRFEIRDRLNLSVPGVGIGGDGIVQLHYHASNLNLPLGTGSWEEDHLGIWYWKEPTAEWVPIGGLVDQARSVVSAKINYLHHYYAVLSVKPEAGQKQIYNVRASPNPFTPDRGDENSSKLKLSFSFAKPHASYTVTIYNMRGQRIREFVRDGSYLQGEVFWDGRHENGFKLPGGVYLYQIRAGGEVFSGSVLVLK